MKQVVFNIEPLDFSDNAKQQYQELGSYNEGSLDQLLNDIIREDVTILIVRLAHYIDQQIIDALPSLKYIVSATTGHDHLHVDYLEEKGVQLISLRGHDNFLKTIPSTAEHTWALLMSLLRNIPAANEHVKQGSWDRDLFKGYQLQEKRIGIVGLGRTGKKVARYAQAFDMQISYFDPFVESEEYLRYDQLISLLNNNDFVSLHIHLKEDTVGMIHDELLNEVQHPFYLINTSRGKVVDELAIARHLEHGTIKGYATDVLSTELEDIQNSSVWRYALEHSNVIITPHIAGATYDAMHSCEEFIVGLVRDIV